MLFVVEEGKNMKIIAKIIYCPSCNRQVAVWDGISSINTIVKCQKCKKLVVYRPKNGNVELKELPERNTASGKRFL